jgi:hypothetical protein
VQRVAENAASSTGAASILERGYAGGAFRRTAEGIDVHMMISAFCFFFFFFRMSSRYTFGAARRAAAIASLSIASRPGGRR